MTGIKFNCHPGYRIDTVAISLLTGHTRSERATSEILPHALPRHILANPLFSSYLRPAHCRQLLKLLCDKADKRYDMNLARYMTENLVKLEMETIIETPPENGSRSKWQAKNKEKVLDELVTLLDSGARIGNRGKLLTDFVNRERQTSTGIGNGIAIPHIRSKHAKEFVIAFARSTEGYDFDSVDGQPSHLFFVMAAPPYDDAVYLRVFKSLAEMLRQEQFRQELMKIQSPGEIIRVVGSMG